MRKALSGAAFIAIISLPLSSQNSFNCTSHEVYERMMLQDPVFKKNQEQLEQETASFINNQSLARPASGATYIIPVVFHIIYTAPAGNISDAQVLDQINILNKEFNRQQADTSLTPSVFKPLAAAFNVEFRLATIDPNGNCTNGINRVYSSLANCSVRENDVKALSYWPSSQYLNIWITQSMHYSGLATCDGGGYATFPGGPANIDGVNIRGDLISNIGTAATNTGWGNFKGRYLVHELGHWFNLRHIWGDATCGNDMVADTPPAVTSNNSCPTFPHNPFNSCGSNASGEMFMDYMDYTNGPCLNMFTAGQVARMTAAINSNVSGRNNLWTAANLNATGTNNPYTYPSPCAAVPAVLQDGPIVACVGDSVVFTDNSYGGLKTSLLWDFDGEPSSSLTDSIVKVKYTFPGVYSFSLTNSYPGSTKTNVFNNKVYILSNTGNSKYFVPFEDSFETPNDFYSDWTIIDDDNDTVTWNLNASTAYTGDNCIGIANFNNVAPTIDEAISPPYDLTAVQNPSLSFRLNFTAVNSNNSDQLQIFISNNCGRTWTSIYLRAANGNLKTNTTYQASSYTPAVSSSEWRLENVNLNPVLASGVVRFRFTFTGGGGNNIFIDDINVDGFNTTGIRSYNKDSRVLAFPNPASEQLTLKCDLKNTKDVAIEVTDLLGKHVMLVNAASLEKENTVKLNINGLENGVYFLKVKQKDAVIYSGKFIKQNGDQ